jgi:hypothetical protein
MRNDESLSLSLTSDKAIAIDATQSDTAACTDIDMPKTGTKPTYEYGYTILSHLHPKHIVKLTTTKSSPHKRT